MGIKETLMKRQGERLRQLQKEQGLTQAKIGSDVGVSQKMISAIMNGRALLREEYAEVLAEKYGYRGEWLLGHDPYKTKADLKNDMQEKNIEMAIADFARAAGYKVSMTSWTNVDEDEHHITPSQLADMHFKNPSTGEDGRLSRDKLKPIGQRLISYAHFLIWQALQETKDREVEVIENFGEWLRSEE